MLFLHLHIYVLFMLLHGTESFDNHDNGEDLSGKISSSFDIR